MKKNGRNQVIQLMYVYCISYLFGSLSHVCITLKLQQDMNKVVQSAIRLMIKISGMILQFVVEAVFKLIGSVYCNDRL